MSRTMTTRIYWGLRPDRRNGSDDFVYFQIHIKFGPLDPASPYFSRQYDTKTSLELSTIWKTWKYFDVHFDPFRTIKMDEGKEENRSWWAFEVEYDMPKTLQDCTTENCLIRSIKQSPLNDVTIPEDNDVGLHHRNLMLVNSINDEFMP